MSLRIDWCVELSLVRPARYRVKRGQTLLAVALAFSVPPRLLAAVNHLQTEPAEGELLVIPPAENLYRVHGGESRALLCGSPERFARKNATDCLYPGQIVAL